MFRTLSFPGLLANKVPTNSVVALLVGYFAAGYRSVLAKIDKPTLIVALKSAYASVLVDMQKQIPGPQITVLDGVGHALFVDDADQLNSAVAAFLRSSVAPHVH